MFKNAIAYKVTPGFRFDADILRRRTARECLPTESSSDGFTEPCAHSTDGLVHLVAGYQLICWQTDDKILPGSVVDEAVQEHAEKIESEQGYRPGRKQMREIKEVVRLELLPRAFVQKRRTFAILGGGYLIIDTSSPARADAFLEAIKLALGVLPFTLIQTTQNPSAAMAVWLCSGEPPYQITIDSECVLELLSDAKPVIHYSRVDLGDRDIIRRVEAGYKPKKIGLTFDDKVSFVMTSNLQIGRIQMLDLVSQAERHQQATDAADEFDGDVTICAGELTRLFDHLIEQFGGVEKPEGDGRGQ